MRIKCTTKYEVTLSFSVQVFFLMGFSSPNRCLQFVMIKYVEGRDGLEEVTDHRRIIFIYLTSWCAPCDFGRRVVSPVPRS